MIAVDTSALMAIVLGEAEGDACMTVLEAETEVLISAGALAEAFIVAGRRAVGEEITSLIGRLGFEIVSVTPASPQRTATAYALWGSGVHPAGLNFGDCFSYEVAKGHSCPLLYVGDDFSKLIWKAPFSGKGCARWHRPPENRYE